MQHANGAQNIIGERREVEEEKSPLEANIKKRYK